VRAAVLVVEDEPDLRELLMEVLALEGHAVTGTGSGLEAVRLAGRTPFDIIFLDIDLRELSGDAVVRVVRDLGSAPIVAVSGKAGDWQQPLLDAGANACLSKPYRVEQLRSLITSFTAAGGEDAGWPGDVRALSPEDLARVARLTPEERDRLPFGAIAVAPDGRIAAYNSFEARASGLEVPAVVGMRFADLAPCTQVKEFVDNLDRGLAGEELDEVLRFTFPHDGALCLVNVRLYRDAAHARVWLFVSKRTES
jgi:photoactive yellow protein